MTLKFKWISLFMIFCGWSAFMLIGCGGGGGGGGGSVALPTANSTIAGTVTAPVVTTPGIAAQISETNDQDLLAKMASDGTCTVNGTSYPFALVTTTRFYTIQDVPPADSYDVRLQYKNLELRTRFPADGTYYTKPLNIDSTVKAWVIEKYQLTPTQMKSWDIKPEYIDALATKFQGWLQTPTSDLSGFQSNWANELASLTSNVPVASLTSDLTPAVNLTGKWTGTNFVFYNFNAFGERGMKVTADIAMELKQSGNTVTGLMEIYPRQQEAVGEMPIPEPEHHSTINGTISSTRFSFTADGREKWEFETLSRMMRGKVTNLDQDKFLGIESEEGAISLSLQ
jgi:hypothetical protein